MIRDDLILDCAIDLVVVAGLAVEIIAAWEGHDLNQLRSGLESHSVIEIPTRVQVVHLFFLPEAVSPSLAHVEFDRRRNYVDGPHAIWEAWVLQREWVEIVGAIDSNTLAGVSNTWATMLGMRAERDDADHFLRLLVGLCRQAHQGSLDVVMFEKLGRS